MGMVLRKIRFNAEGVVPLIAQGCQTIVQATLGKRMVCGKQRRRCCAFSALSAIKCFIVNVPSQKKLNTDGVESPCERLPGVGSFLANPGLSKEQLVPSCVVKQLWG